MAGKRQRPVGWEWEWHSNKPFLSTLAVQSSVVLVEGAYGDEILTVMLGRFIASAISAIEVHIFSARGWTVAGGSGPRHSKGRMSRFE